MCVLFAQSYLTLCDPTDCSLPGFSASGILQARAPEWIAIPLSRNILLSLLFSEFSKLFLYINLEESLVMKTAADQIYTYWLLSLHNEVYLLILSFLLMCQSNYFVYGIQILAFYASWLALPGSLVFFIPQVFISYISILYFIIYLFIYYISIYYILYLFLVFYIL